MARTYAKLKGSIWRDQDWRNVPAVEQRLYLLLVSQPDITNCGVIPYVPAKWARMAPDTTIGEVEDGLQRLQMRHLIAVDTDSCELLVRTFVKHDQVLEQPKIKEAAQRQYGTIESSRIRTILANEYPDVFALTKEEKPHPNPWPNPTLDPTGNPSDSTLPLTLSQGSSRAANRQPPPLTATAPTNRQQQPAALTADELEIIGERLKQAGWDANQLTAATLDPARAIGWLDHAEANPRLANPGGLAWARFSAGNDVPREFAEAPFADPSAVCADCGATIGEGHFEDCPRLLASVSAAASAPVPAVDELPERDDSAPERARSLLERVTKSVPTEVPA